MTDPKAETAYTPCGCDRPDMKAGHPRMAGCSLYSDAPCDDGPECETCGKTTCPDADLPGFSEPRRCTFAPVFHAFRDAVDCDYGCGRDLTNAAIRRGVVRAVEAMATKFKADGVREAADALYLTRSGQVHEEAKDWLHRRANLIDPRTRNEVCEHGNPPESDCALCAHDRHTRPEAVDRG